MTKKISLVASSLLLTSTMAFAESASIKDAFKNGSVSGDITVFATTVEDDNSDSGFTSGTFGLNYETASYKGFKVMAGFRANHEFGEEEDGDYEGEFENDAIMHTAAISYANDDFFISVGRQEIDLEWLGDYNESVVAGVTAIPNTTIIAGYTDRQAAVAEDESKDFDEITEDGAYVIDIKNTSFENFTLNPFFYSAPDVADFYGSRLSYESDLFGASLLYTSSNEDSSTTTDDGSVFGIDLSTSVAGVSLNAGYITTDDDGMGSIAAYGDNLDPTDWLGDYVYAADADTYYVGAAYSVAGLDLSAQYSDVEYGNLEANEIYLTAGYAFTDELSVTVEYTDGEYDDDKDFDELSATLTYAF